MRGLRRWALPALCLSAASLVRHARRLGARPRAARDPYLEAGVPPAPRPAGDGPARKDAAADAEDGAGSARRRQQRPRPSRSDKDARSAASAATGDFWENAASSCFHVDSVCSWDDGWFYAPSSEGAAAWQPTIALLVDASGMTQTHGYDLEVDPHLRFNVSAAAPPPRDGRACPFASAPVHLVAQSAYSEMMGEFYSRAILPLNRWLRAPPRRPAADVETYLHFVDRRKQRMFEGHRLFLGGLPNNDRFHNLLDLMPRNDSCQCYAKLVFCGYDVGNVTAATLNVTRHEGARVAPEDNITVFTPRGQITNPATACTAQTDAWSLMRDGCAAYRRLRRELFDTYAKKDPGLGDKIRDHRRRILKHKGFLRDGGRPEEWKFVGLADRKYRRKWLNIRDVVAMCDAKFRRHKIACVTVDVEEAASPEQQLLTHRSLHALVGVHGAQLTQGVLLPRGGYVLELLPWVPPYLWGAWVATTHRPTPLGIIFHNTDLNHVGYPLGRGSVPLCGHVDAAEQEEDRACLMDNATGTLQKFRWADRDFNVPVAVIERFLTAFVREENDTVCEGMQARAYHDFVLYNAFCRRNTSQTGYVTEHYYREKDDKEPPNIHDWGVRHKNKTR